MSSFSADEPKQPTMMSPTFEDEVAAHLHEVVAAAREVPAEHQPERLRNALTALVSLGIVSTGTTIVERVDNPGYLPGTYPSS
jgi:hypothetical protein